MEHPHVRGLSEWRPLARGGLAMVWEARQLSLERLVAVKVYQAECDRRRIRREAAALGRLSDHPGIVTGYDAGVLPDDDRPYLMMKLYPGGSLAQWLEPENRPSDERVRQVGVRIADALAFAHAQGVLHGDVKPAHILIDNYGNPGLADFGMAAVADAETAVADPQSLTPAYAPPEAFEMQPATESGDVFSLAATLYALIAGSPPRRVAADVTPEQMIVVAKRPIGPLPGANPRVMDVLMTALSNDPTARPTAVRFRDELANVPVPRSSKRARHGGAAANTSSVFAHGDSVVPGHSASSNSHSVAVTAAPADSPPAPGQLAPAEALRWRGRRRVSILALAGILVAVIASATAWLISEPATSGAPAAMSQSATPGGLPSSASSPGASEPGTPTSSTTPAPSNKTGAGSAGEETIQPQVPTNAAKTFQPVRIQGSYHGGEDTFLRVQRWDGDRWLDFPVPTKTDRSGHFNAYVEIGRPGRYRLRVLDPASGVTSKPFVLAVKG